jgi:hypothetical protein
MAKLDARLERTFVRLWTHCDDEGRCEDRPKIIKAAIYPEHDNQTPEVIDQELAALAADQLIVRYEVAGRAYIQVTSWDEYQHPQKPRPSDYPKPPRLVRDTDDSPPVQVPNGYASGVGSGEGEGIGEGDKSSPETQDDDAFESFWSRYPSQPNGKKPERKKAAAEWKRLSSPLRELALNAVDHYRADCDAGGYAKHAFRWLRDRTFEDWQTPAKPRAPGRRDPFVDMAEHLLNGGETNGRSQQEDHVAHAAGRGLSAGSHS